MIIYDSYINKAEGTGVNYRRKIFNEARRRGLLEEKKDMEKRVNIQLVAERMDGE